MAADHYSAFVEEAFIQPIRSVLIVDDDYPTFDEMLDGRIAEIEGKDRDTSKEWHKKPERIRKVIQNFRRPDRPLLVDIHDGTNVTGDGDIEMAAHLHQSDLLVLDYQLDKAKKGDGTIAIQILRRLMLNDHFNLVVVHTSEDLETVFRDTLISLLVPIGFDVSEGDRLAATQAIENAEANGDDEILNRLRKSIAEEQYLGARDSRDNYLRKIGKGEQPFSAFKDECMKAGWPADLHKVVARYLLDRFQETLKGRMYAGPEQPAQWSEAEIKYIYADKVFIAFSSKSDDDDLLSELLESLNAWRPPPSRLFLAKMRAEMDEYGVMAQGSVLENRYALAHWYRRLLQNDGKVRRWLISESLARHSEQLMSTILPRVEIFATKLVAAEANAADGNVDALNQRHFGVDLTKPEQGLMSEREHNAFAGSKPPEGWHLTTGHVFTLGSDYWVCVSPACDMVPTQLGADRIAMFGERLPFMAVRLHAVADAKKLSDVNTNRYVFIRMNAAVKTFCFNNPSDPNSSPNWQMLLAGDRGQFHDGFDFRVFASGQKNGRLVQRRHNARVVGQLRYEYALNLMQRLGGSITRVGLDFV